MSAAGIVTWDGKNFAAVQMLLSEFRYDGAPLARVDCDWRLRLEIDGGSLPIAPDWSIAVGDDGTIAVVTD